jgi:hypothetical protein
VLRVDSVLTKGQAFKRADEDPVLRGRDRKPVRGIIMDKPENIN